MKPLTFFMAIFVMDFVFQVGWVVLWLRRLTFHLGCEAVIRIGQGVVSKARWVVFNADEVDVRVEMLAVFKADTRAGRLQVVVIKVDARAGGLQVVEARAGRLQVVVFKVERGRPCTKAPCAHLATLLTADLVVVPECCHQCHIG